MTDDLKSFKIQGQAGVKQPTKKDPPPPPPPSVGFPHIEAVVEANPPDLSGLATRLAQLQELAKSGSNKDKLAAKKAAAAYEKAQALLDYLLETKARLANPPAG